ncbi:MAG TPA: HEPN domain-containing protein [Candidatus Desulfofervidus auxilii]|uniref:HEPN domain-containing protein n=1 Tax=Desulfofervidus auxilii TaxID=1621989 RepID=A0A7C0Y1Y3_DESA2|nr:HEPN domain-containing protein [Candidatus Desulfofervidus auxilii]HDD43767.1 HEPN domain-containing protein [Candidatus Desulfofervidus auxilii]
MTNVSLAQSYLIKAQKRLKILQVLLEEEDYSDVIREAQEIVELAQKAMLRQVGIDPPKWHDVGMIILDNKEKFPKEIQPILSELAQISKWLRKERELSFYGDIDFIPTEEYTKEDALRAIEGAKKIVEVASKIIKIKD